MSYYFGEPWPSGICDDGTRMPTPVGEDCLLCGDPIETDDQGSFMGAIEHGHAVMQAVHKECSMRSVMGGIGHIENHAYWCGERRDPDGGRTYRQSALEVWIWVQEHGVP